MTLDSNQNLIVFTVLPEVPLWTLHHPKVLDLSDSIFTAEVTAIYLALGILADSGQFLIFSDSLSILLSFHNKKRDNPLIFVQLLQNFLI